MKIKSKWLAILLTLGLVLAACGGDGEGTTTTAGGGEETTTTEDVGEETTTTMGEEMTPPNVDIGVDLEAGTISIGLLADLTGVFSPLVTQIVAGHEAYWAYVNANGGIHGLEVVPEIVDTAYDGPTHVQLFEELRDEVVAFGQSTGSPQTVAINAGLQEQGMLAIPLTWYSGWSDPAFNSNLVPHGTPYCIEAMNIIEYMVEQSGLDAPTIAIVSIPGDYGLDASAGAMLAAEALGLEVVYDGIGAVNPADAATIPATGNAIAAADPDLVYYTGIPHLGWPEVYETAVVTGGLEAIWSGASPSWDPSYMDRPSAELIARDFIISGYLQPWSGDSEGAALVRELMEGAGQPPSDFYGEGFVEAMIMHAALDAAYESGDMTQAGVLAAAKSLESVDFMGLAPTEQYVGEPNDIVQRAQWIQRPNLDSETGADLVEEAYTSEIAAAYEFNSACYVLEG